MTHEQEKILNNLPKPVLSVTQEISSKPQGHYKKKNKLNYEKLINFKIEDKVMQQIELDISNLNKIQKQKIHLDKRSALLYEGQGVFPSKNNYKKFLEMGEEEEKQK